MQNTETKYKALSYKKFIVILSKLFDDYTKSTDKGWDDVAAIMGKTSITIRNCFKPNQQAVSDEVLTSLMKVIKMEGKIEYHHGVKTYYVLTEYLNPTN